MAYRRKRKFKGTWFPVYGTDVEPNDIPAMGIQQSIVTQSDGSVATVISRVIPDEPQEDASFSTLNQLVGQEYALRRIVGKLAVVWTGSSGSATPQSVVYAKVAAGFFIARADPTTPDLPLGVTAAGFGSTANPDEYNSFSPLSPEAIREPWIWRRTWVLSKSVFGELSEGESVASFSAAPPSNLWFGSLLDGGHIDAKTRRRTHSDERLYFAISAANWPYVGGDAGYTLTYDWDLDVRLFGAMRRAQNKGAF